MCGGKPEPVYYPGVADTPEYPDGIAFVDRGDPRRETLIYDHRDGRFVLNAWGPSVARQADRFKAAAKQNPSRSPHTSFEVSLPTQFVTNPRRSPDLRAYTHYSTYVDDNGVRKITAGWEHTEDARDAVAGMRLDAKNIGMSTEGMKVYTRVGLLRLGLDPKNPSNWDEPFAHQEAPRVHPRRAMRAALTLKENPSTPSAKRLAEGLGLLPTKAKTLKEKMDTGSVEDALAFADKAMNGFGVEYIASSEDTMRTPDGLDYVNMGDTYDTTLVYDHGKGKYVITSWGDIVEADMRLPRKRQRFAY
jgi:hypothetical protein